MLATERTTLIRIDETGEWARCGRCGHKLFKINKGNRQIARTGIEVKCHSCKAVNTFEQKQK